MRAQHHVRDPQGARAAGHHEGRRIYLLRERLPAVRGAQLQVHVLPAGRGRLLREESQARGSVLQGGQGTVRLRT